MTEADRVILDEVRLLANNLGPWKKSVIVGGGVALLLYDQFLTTTPAGAVGTTDIDLLIGRKPVVPAGTETIAKLLYEQGYAAEPKDVGHPPIEVYVKEINNLDIEVEFLTHARKRGTSDSVAISGAGIVAQPLSYLEMSIETGVELDLGDGKSIQVVDPAAWVFHKGLTFERRKPGSSKKEKDLYGIWFALTQLGERSDLTLGDLFGLQSRHSQKWTKDFTGNLLAWVDSAAPKDWQKLLSQDPKGRLTETNFRELIRKLCS